jgi:atypical dual specificity phosphatase
MHALESIKYVQAKRGIVAPNLGFRKQLVIWGRQFEEAKIQAEKERRKRRNIGSVAEVLAKIIKRSKSPSGPAAPVMHEDLPETSLEDAKTPCLTKTVALEKTEG